MILLVPLRLGLKSFNFAQYGSSLRKIFRLKQCIGFIGGSVRHAQWFIGCAPSLPTSKTFSSSSFQLYGLDPHTVQMAPQRRNAGSSNKVSLDNYIKSVIGIGAGGNDYKKQLSVMDMKRLDPSLCLGFYCINSCEFENLCANLDKIYDGSDGSSSMFEVIDLCPDFHSGNQDIEALLECGDDEDDIGAYESDDDDYVFL